MGTIWERNLQNQSFQLHGQLVVSTMTGLIQNYVSEKCVKTPFYIWILKAPEKAGKISRELNFCVCVCWEHLSDLFHRERGGRNTLCCSMDGLRAVLTLETKWQDPESYCWAAELILLLPHSSLEESTQLCSSLASASHNCWSFISIYLSAGTLQYALALLLSLYGASGAPGWVQFSDWWRL